MKSPCVLGSLQPSLTIPAPGCLRVRWLEPTPPKPVGHISASLAVSVLFCSGTLKAERIAPRVGMNLSKLDSALWAAFSVTPPFWPILYHPSWQVEGLPCLHGIHLAFHSCLSPVLCHLQYGTGDLVLPVYWSSALLDFGLQLGVGVFEVARIVLRPTGTWVQDAEAIPGFWRRWHCRSRRALPW